MDQQNPYRDHQLARNAQVRLVPFFMVCGLLLAFLGGHGFSWIGAPLNIWMLLASWFPYAAIICVFVVLLAKRVKPDIRKVALFLLMGSVCILSIPAFLFANKALDRSLEERITRTVVTREIYKSSKGNVTYYAIFEGDPLTRNLQGEQNKVEVNSALYRSLDPGRTRVELRIKEGYLGVPWLAGKNWQNLKVEDTPQSYTPAPAPGNSAAREAALEWTNAHPFPTKMSFDPETAPHQQEKWPNGEVMQIEPLHKGTIHGVAGYWFDNGQLYGYIPYEMGRKNGCFRLYRADGNLDQDLCYRDGQLYGVCRWYKEDGSLLGQAIYYDGQDHPL